MTKHDGKEMPCDGDRIVKIKQRDGNKDTAPASEFGWVHRLDYNGEPWSGDIVSWEYK